MRSFHVSALAVVGVFCAFGVAGCISVPIPKAEADATRYYVLSSEGGRSAVQTDAPIVYLRPIEVATYLNSRPLVVRRGDHEIEFKEFARWGEPLELGIARVVREGLLGSGAVSKVLTSGARGRSGETTFELNVRVLACEGSADGAVIFRARWELAPSEAKGGATRSGDYRPMELRWDGKNGESLASQLSVAVAGLAKEISSGVESKKE